MLISFTLVPIVAFQLDPAFKRQRLVQAEFRGNANDEGKRAARSEFWPFGIWNPLGGHRHRHSPEQNSIASGDDDGQVYGTYVQRLENLGDVQYTGEVVVGGKALKAVIDTGSFELLVFGAACTTCAKTAASLYNHTLSRTYTRGHFPGTHSFGSGVTYSTEAFDTMAVGPFAVSRQAFWEVYDANMDILQADAFQAILGVGPPGGAAKLAAADAKQIHKELKMYEQFGRKATAQMNDTVQRYDEAEEHAMHMTQAAERFEFASMSVCLGKESQSDGFFSWNDSSTAREPSKFVKVAVVGNQYWSANLTDVAVDPFVFDAFVNGSDGEEPFVLGCRDTVCSAVIDTGTSLLAAPSSVVDRIQKIVEKWVGSGGSCDDISTLPDLEFRINGVKLSLPPGAYIGRIDGKLDIENENVRKFMPHLVSRLERYSPSSECEPLILSMDAETDIGPLWIFGMPFFRKYFTSFHFGRSADGNNRLQADAMSLSIATPECRPGDAPGANSQLFSTTRRQPTKAHLRVDASKILFPTAKYQRSARDGL
jgi:hypothetical protein